MSIKSWILGFIQKPSEEDEIEEYKKELKERYEGEPLPEEERKAMEELHSTMDKMDEKDGEQWHQIVKLNRI